MKKLLLMLSVAFMFSACNKCVECTATSYNGQTEEWYVYNDDDNTEDTFGDRIIEVCSDNFESKKDFNNYIDAIEDEGVDCKSDFWN